MSLNDKEILDCIRKGENTKILQLLYEKILPKICKYICKNSGTEEDAFDIFQDGVMIFYNYVISGKFNEKYEIAGFLYTVCKNLWINKIRHDQLLLRIIIEERESEERRLLAELGEKCRQLLQLVFYYQLTTREICDKMGFANEDTLKTKKYKCKQRLLEIINNSRN